MTILSLVLSPLFWLSHGVSPKGKKSAALSEEKLQSWKLLQQFRALLDDSPAKDSQSNCPRKGGQPRLLSEEDYLCSFLFAQFNPVIDSMRGLCACSKFQKVQDQVCTRKMSLGSFSEAQSVFGFEPLEAIFQKLSEEAISQPGDPLKSSSTAANLAQKLRLVDSSVFKALPRMSWAHWRTQGKQQSAIRLHLKFQVLGERPTGAVVSPAKLCERKALEMIVKPGEFYVGDRYYGRSYKFLERLKANDCGFVIRLCDQAVITKIEDLPLSKEDRAAGVVSDELVELGAGSRYRSGPFRIVRVEKPELDEPVILVTNQLASEDLPAAQIAEIYHQRWAIELFFRWLKCIFGRRKQWHWFAESPEGVTIQLYSALIAALLLAKRQSKLPTKRQFEALQWHQLGMISDEELESSLNPASSKKSK